jgi:hypothetical protein
MDYQAILARNLAHFMNRPGAPYPNANALGVACGMSPNTIRKMLTPAKRVYQSRTKGAGLPASMTLVLLSEKLGCDVWELLHPDLERAHALMRAGEAAAQALKPEAAPVHQPRRGQGVRYSDADFGRQGASQPSEPYILPAPNLKRA